MTFKQWRIFKHGKDKIIFPLDCQDNLLCLGSEQEFIRFTGKCA